MSGRDAAVVTAEAAHVIVDMGSAPHTVLRAGTTERAFEAPGWWWRCSCGREAGHMDLRGAANRGRVATYGSEREALSGHRAHVRLAMLPKDA